MPTIPLKVFECIQSFKVFYLSISAHHLSLGKCSYCTPDYFFTGTDNFGDTCQTVVPVLLPFSLCFQYNECAYWPRPLLKDCVTSVAQIMATFTQQFLEFQLNVFVDYLYLMQNHQIVADVCRQLFNIPYVWHNWLSPPDPLL